MAHTKNVRTPHTSPRGPRRQPADLKPRRPDTAPVACTACGVPRALPDPFFYLWRGRRFTIYRCGDCTHQFVYPPVTAADQALIYSDRYFERDGDWVCSVFDEGYINAEADLRSEATEILGLAPKASTHPRLLDIGCAGGVFLDEARKAGFQVRGLEINTRMARHARATYTLDVTNSRIEDVEPFRWRHAFDLVTLLDCLEHIPSPLDALRKVHRWLAPGGAVFIRGPLANSALAVAKETARRILGVTKQLPGYPLDASTFSKKSLEAALSVAGFARPEWHEAPGFANLIAYRI